jgi:hypothetical protein
VKVNGRAGDAVFDSRFALVEFALSPHLSSLPLPRIVQFHILLQPWGNPE